MTPADRDRAVKQLEDTIALVKAMPVVTPCAQCFHFIKIGNEPGFCNKWEANVPEDAQAAGCGSWEEPVPF